MLIRPLTPADLDAAVAATAHVGWGNLRPHFAFYLERSDCCPLVAEEEGRIVGTAAGTRKGGVGWIGHVVVHPDCRRRGIGSALVEAVIARLEEAGCRALLLIATDLGRPVYEKLGFRVDSLYARLNGPTLDAFPMHPDLRALAESDLPAIRSLDRLASGEDRAAHLRLAPSGWVVGGAGPGEVRGFYLPLPWAEGPLVATDPEAMALLLDAARATAKAQRGQSEVRFTIPAENAAGIAHLRACGFVETPPLPRMIRGEPLAWRPELVGGRFSGALG